VVPILMKLRRGNNEKRELLILENIEDGMYKDSTGKVYQVKEIDTEQSAPADTDNPGR